MRPAAARAGRIILCGCFLVALSYGPKIGLLRRVLKPGLRSAWYPFRFSHSSEIHEKGSIPDPMTQPHALLRIILAALLCCAAATTQTQKTAPTPPVPQQPSVAEPKVNEPPHELTAADVGAFVDGFMPMQLERENIAGAVVLVVKDGKVLFAKGYGYSDVDKKTPVTVDATLFRPGSISQLFTSTALMQLAEQRKLHLDPALHT